MDHGDTPIWIRFIGSVAQMVATTVSLCATGIAAAYDGPVCKRPFRGIFSPIVPLQVLVTTNRHGSLLASS